MSANSSFRWTSSTLTHVGNVRKHNEDNLLELADQQLWLVADGMGGHAKGDVASQIVVDSMQAFTRSHSLTDNINDIEDRLISANIQCRAQGDPNAKKKMMGSTAVVLFPFGKHVYFIWIGDSRIYRMRNGEIKQMSVDHSLVQEMVEAGTLSPEDAETHPSGNVITRAVGVAENMYIDLDYDEVQDGDRYLLCSDGLTKDLRDEDIAKPLAELPIDMACKILVELELKAGGGDNITTIIAEAHSD